MFDLMTKWIERYQRQAEERFQRLDALLARMDDEGNLTDDRTTDQTRPGTRSVMTTTTHREAQIVADPDVPTSPITREFDAPPERVFKAWEDPELVKIWMGPRSVDMDIQAWDCRTGGSYRYAASRDGEAARASFYGSFHEVRPGERLVQTWTWEGMPDAVCLETMTFEALEGGRSRIVVVDRARLHGGPGRHAGQRHGGRHQRGLREARRAAGVRSRMTAAPRSTGGSPAIFTDRVRGATDWDAPAPVEGWTARDVVRHLVEWFPSFLEAGAGVRLASGPSVDDDPVAAWQVHSDAVQALLDDPDARRRRCCSNPPHRRGPARPGGRPVLHGRRLHAHVGPGPRDRAGRDARRRQVRRACSPGMEPIEDAHAVERPVRPEGRGPRRRRRADADAGVHRPQPALRSGQAGYASRRPAGPPRRCGPCRAGRAASPSRCRGRPARRWPRSGPGRRAVAGGSPARSRSRSPRGWRP